MPALPDVPQVLRIVTKYTVGTDINCINRFFVHYTGTAPDNTGLTQMAGNAGTSWVTNMAPLCHPTVSLEQTTITDLTSTSSGQGVNTFHHPGTRTGGVLPAGTCAMIDGHIQRRYRGGKPRTYLPAGTDTDLVNSQTWTTTFTAALLPAWSNFLSGIVAPAGTTTTSAVMVSYYHGFENKEGSTGRMHARSLPRSTPIIDVITSFGVDPRVASQRRRNRP